MIIRNCCLLQRHKERGRIAVESVHVVETASLGNSSTGGGGGAVGDVASGGDAAGGGGGIPSGLPFQVGYREAGQEYTLYLLAAREQDRTEWIRAIRAGESLFLYFPAFFLLFFLHCHSIRVRISCTCRAFDRDNNKQVFILFS